MAAILVERNSAGVGYFYLIRRGETAGPRKNGVCARNQATLFTHSYKNKRKRQYEKLELVG